MENEKNLIELAYNAAGDSFPPPANATDWRIKRTKPRGAPDLMYSADGRPLLLPIEATLDELREAVGQPGRYRLDPVDGDGRLIEGSQPAYIQIGKAERSEPATARAATTSNDDVLRDVLRLNAELARQVARPVTTATDELLRDVVRMNTGLANAVIERFASMMDSGAGVIAAADGAGLPAREPRELADEPTNNDTPDAASPPGVPPQIFNVITTVVTEVANNVVTKLMNRYAPAPAPTAAKAAPTAPASATTTPTRATPTNAASSPVTAAVPASEPLPPIDPAMMLKMHAIQSQLTKDEADVARALGAELAPAELRAWLAELSALSVPDAVTRVRALIGSPPSAATTSAGGVS